jgi:hypothetical protein
MGFLFYHMVNPLVEARFNAKLFLHNRRSTILLLDSTMLIFSLRFQFEFKSMNNWKKNIPNHHPIDVVTNMNFGSSC